MAKPKKKAAKKSAPKKEKRERSPKQKALDKRNSKVMRAAYKVCTRKHKPFTKAHGKCVGAFRKKAAKKH